MAVEAIVVVVMVAWLTLWLRRAMLVVVMVVEAIVVGVMVAWLALWLRGAMLVVVMVVEMWLVQNNDRERKTYLKGSQPG